MSWQKWGLIYAPSGRHTWDRTHAAVPTVDPYADDRWRIYYASRDAQNRSHTSYIEVDARDPRRVLYEHPEPILPLGPLGAFDECGIMPSWIVDVGAQKYLYYIGWTVRKTVPYHNAVGLAISDDGGRTFRKWAAGPLFGSTATEPYFTGTSCVLWDEGVWKNWYMSCTKWERIQGRPEPFYHLKVAESPDGLHWDRRGEVAIDYQSDEEAGIVRASVCRDASGYRMWYAFRHAVDYRTDPNHGYRIGYAVSDDGHAWQRQDALAGIERSDAGWDSQMITYPHVISVAGMRYMFYNGNGFGASGFGLAVQPVEAR